MSVIGVIGCIVGAWIVSSTLLVAILCMNSSRLNRIDDKGFSAPKTDWQPFIEELFRGYHDEYTGDDDD